jgi:aminopeptidase N
MLECSASPCFDGGMPRLRRAWLAAVCAPVLVTGLLVPAAAAAAPSTVGARGAGDPYYPRQGNGGYNVADYRLTLRYQPRSHALRGLAVIHAKALKNLTRFDLDLRPDMHATAVGVDGRRAGHSQPRSARQELVVTPARMLHRGKHFTVRVRYGGTARSLHDPDGSLDGWIHTDDGAFVAGEPQGAPTWFPVNDTPRDKATYSVSVNVPKGFAAISNGRLLSHRTAHGRTTWRWRLGRPVPSYLVTATVGHFRIHTGRTGPGVPYLIAVDPTVAAAAGPVLRKLPRIVTFFSHAYGRYPFGQTGAIVDNATRVGYALETATRPLFDRAPDELTLAHELAHQWYGDDVTLRQWRDIWLNEGFAEFSSWLWDEHRGGMSAHRHLMQLLAEPASSSVWSPPPANPGSAAAVFSNSVYERGAGTLQALRQRVGNKTFFSIMRGWLRAHRYGNATVPQFTRFAAHVAHRDLTRFFRVWLYRHGKP